MTNLVAVFLRELTSEFPTLFPLLSLLPGMLRPVSRPSSSEEVKVPTLPSDSSRFFSFKLYYRFPHLEDYWALAKQLISVIIVPFLDDGSYVLSNSKNPERKRR